MKVKRFLAMLSVAVLALPAAATEYYASPTGSSSTGTSYDAPGKLSTMLSKLKAGDVLYLLGGQYDFNSRLSFNKSGTADNYITICAYGDEKPILDFRKAANKENGVTMSNNKYVHLKGITIRYSGYKGIWLEGSQYCILENLDVYGCCNAGIQLRSGGHNLVLNCDAHDNFDYQDNGGNADGFADKQGNECPGNIYIGCRAWGNSDDGWDSFQRVTSGTPTVYINCITYNNGPATFDLTSHPRATGVDASLSCFSGKNLASFANGGNPNGFKVGGKGTAHDVELYRCLAVGHRSKGFDQNNNAGNMKIVNCTGYKNKYNYGFGNNYNYTLTLKNCISLSPTGGSSSHLVTSSSGTVVQSHNTWNEGFSVSESDFEGLDIERIILAERNADGSLPETVQFHLKQTATGLIDKGTDYTDFSGEQIADYVSYNGSAPDLGCYETSAATAIEHAALRAASGTSPLIYNLVGQQVRSSAMGILVKNGRKIIQK